MRRRRAFCASADGICGLLAWGTCDCLGGDSQLQRRRGTQTGRIGNGPNGAPAAGNDVIVNVNTGATIGVNDTNAISLGNHAIITLFSGSTVQTTTDSRRNTGEYGKGDNTIEFNDNSTLTINTGARVIASGLRRPKKRSIRSAQAMRSSTTG